MRSKFCFLLNSIKRLRKEKKEKKEKKYEIEAVYKMLHFKFKSSACIQ